MSNKPFSQSTAHIRTEACAWIAQLETGDLKPADVDAFREWTQRSPQHAGEVHRLARLSADLNLLTDMAGPLQEAAAHYQPVLAPKSTRWRAALPWVTSFGAALLLLVTVVVMRQSTESAPQQWPLMLTTEVGEYQETTLPDGSTVALNTNSQLKVEYTAGRRSMRLLQGEVLFTVAKNPERPFVVFVGSRSIAAIGTAFLVRHDADSFEVAVTEGQVRLEVITMITPEPAETARLENGIQESPASWDDAAGAQIADHGPILPSAPIVLRAGQQFAISSLDAPKATVPHAVETITQTDLRRKLARQEGLLEFSDTPLNTVIREVSRHTTLKIEISDPALRDLKFGGMFRTGDTEPLFRALHTAYDIQAVYIREDTVRLTRAKSG